MTDKHLNPNPNPSHKGRDDDAPTRILSKGPVAPGQPQRPPEVAPGQPPEEGSMQLPHERDQSAGDDATSGQDQGVAGERQRAVGRQAQRDLASGQVDTDLHQTPGLDAERRDELLQSQRHADQQADPGKGQPRNKSHTQP